MNRRTLVWKELRERPTSLLTCGLAIALGVAALVTIRHVTTASAGEVARQMESLGANVLILPASATLQDYYAADMQQQTIPESHVSQVLLEALPGVEKLSPKLSAPAQIGDRKVTLTGILPQSEFKTNMAWQSVKLFSRKHAGCTKVACGPSPEDGLPTALATQRAIEDLQEFDAILGADVAETTDLKPGQNVMLLGSQFKVLAVLPRTGTVDDSRVFAHLHTVQRLTNAGEVVNCIEVMGCCEDAAGQLVPQLQTLLPDTKVVTISHVVQAQVGVNRLLGNLSWFVVAVLVVVGGVSVAGAISANVRDRRREVGTLMALGASPNYVAAIFLTKALWLGIAAGTLGGIVGLTAAVTLGPRWAGVAVQPLPGLTAIAIGAALAVSLGAAFWPARRAAQLDPSRCFQEV